MLAFLLTDAAASPAFLRGALRRAADASFNRVTVDGETLDQRHRAAASRTARRATPRCAARRAATRAPSRRALARGGDLAGARVARDGEGATRLVTVRGARARSPAEAERAARRIANSLLVKTALFGGDANWGRILQTVGRRPGPARARAHPGAARRRRGFPPRAPAGPAARARAARALRAKEIEVEVRLGRRPRPRRTVWTCDLSYDYVRINADYTT